MESAERGKMGSGRPLPPEAVPMQTEPHAMDGKAAKKWEKGPISAKLFANLELLLERRFLAALAFFADLA